MFPLVFLGGCVCWGGGGSSSKFDLNLESRRYVDTEL
jgi:hypothetical protein